MGNETAGLRFGLQLITSRETLGGALDQLGAWLGEQIGRPVVFDPSATYDELSAKVKEGRVDIAWLPPIVYLRLGEGVVTPIVASRRGDRAGYETALIVRSDSPMRTVDDLNGARAAWVDAWSAAGYVIPRVRLRLAGVDPSVLFTSETFYGSHNAAIEALTSGVADVAATYAQVDAEGRTTGGAWTALGAQVKVLATFGEIPTDVIAVRSSLPEGDRERLTEALLGSGAPREALKRVFGADTLGVVELDRYEVLRSVVRLAESIGVPSDD